MAEVYRLFDKADWVKDFAWDRWSEHFITGIIRAIDRHRADWVRDCTTQQDNVALDKRPIELLADKARSFLYVNRHLLVNWNYKPARPTEATRESVEKERENTIMRAGRAFMQDVVHITGITPLDEVQSQEWGRKGFRCGDWQFAEIKDTELANPIYQGMSQHWAAVRRAEREQCRLKYLNQQEHEILGDWLYNEVLQLFRNNMQGYFLQLDTRSRIIKLNEGKETFLEATLGSDLDDEQKKWILKTFDEADIITNLDLASSERHRQEAIEELRRLGFKVPKQYQ